MPQIVAATYELMEEIGSGGGGVVYLGRHIRLDKQVVLKADKRTLTTKPEVLRREVDALKNISHTYIPQVYDFIAENNTVYTVMDYIEGESLDKPLKRGEHFSQPQVIDWACQLLEALSYLHSRPPHGILHSDIKPANIMLTPQNDIRLIDFNIALALGEEGAVRVGFSQGYASPEHYSSAFPPTVSPSKPAGTERISAETELLQSGTEQLGPETEQLQPETEQSHSSSLSEAAELGGPSSKAVSGMPATELTEMQSGQLSQPANLRPDGLPESQPHSSADSGPAAFPGGKLTSGSSSGSGKRGVLLDVRSDIYSVGATLYHLLTGRRPAKDATKVEPITDVIGISSAVAAIIQKSMNPDPALRYQTAEEMLWAFRHLHENDPRTKRHKRHVRVTTAALVVLFLASGLCSFTGLRQMQQAAQAAEEVERLAKIAEQEAKDALAAVRSSENSYQSGDTSGAVRYALAALEKDTTYKTQAQKALTDALGVYDLSDGFKAAGILELPSEPLDMVLSPEGGRLAVVYAYELAVFDIQTGEMLCQLPTEESALADVKFLNENQIVYAAPGAVSAYDVSRGMQVWSGVPATKIVCSADVARVAVVYKDEQEGHVYNAQTGELLKTVSFQGRGQRVAENDIFADPNDNLLALNADGTLLAASFADGTLAVFDLVGEDDLELLDPSDHSHFEGGFFGKYFAFSAWNGQESIFAVVDTAEIVQTGGFSSSTPFHLQVDEAGICISSDNLLVRLDPETGDQTELAYLDGDITLFQNHDGYTVTTTAKRSCVIFDSDARKLTETDCEYNCDFLQISDKYAVIGSQDTPVIRLLRRETHPESELFSYDPSYFHVEARLSADESTVMLFSVEGFRLYSKDGALLSETEFPDAGHIHDQQYRREEDGTSCLEVIYDDGLRQYYSAQDGSLLREERGEVPDSSLYEEFFTDRLRITSPLHGAPEAYDRETGELISTLEEDAYLTYVTQVENGIITEYTSAQGERYGLLLDENCQVLARLPNLCDVIGEKLIFDYSSGNLRQSRIYSTQELMALAEKYKEEIR